jgi:hypothetical protein
MGAIVDSQQRSKTQSKKDRLSVARLRQCLNYDAETGEFYWVFGRGRVSAGSIAGSQKKEPDGLFYLHIGIDGTQYRAHRLAWLYVHGEWPRQHIDHIDGNPLNNAISNLREATNSENARNRGKTKRNKSGFKGVHWSNTKKRWVATIRHHGKKKDLGSFKDAKAAHDAYVSAALELHGSFARLS